MIKILIDFNRLSHIDTRNFAELIVSKMTNNPKYSIFQAIIAILGTLAADYKAAIFDEDGTIEKRKVKNTAQTEIKQFLVKLAKKVEVAANDLPENERETYAKGTGFNVQEATSAKKSTIDFLEMPSNFKVINDDRPLAALLTYDRVASAKTYVAQEQDKNGVWHDCGATSRLSLVVDGTESDVKRTFRIKAMNFEGVTSGYTNPVSVWVY
jgi:hypothetical protein